MSQFRVLEPQQANQEARSLLEGVQAKLGILPNMFKAMANSPVTLAAYVAISDALAKGRLSAKLREQIALTVAETNGCQYCLAAHSALGKSVGLSIEEISNNRRAQSADPSASAALTFAKSLVTKRGKVTFADVDRLREAGFDDGQIAEIVTTVTLNILTNYFNLTAATPLDFPKAESLTSAA